MSTFKDLKYRVMPAIKFAGDGRLTNPSPLKGRNLTALFLGKLIAVMSFAALGCGNAPSWEVSTLGNHVIHIGLVVSQEEMSGINAFRIVASMANELTARNGAKVNCVGNAMRGQGFTANRSFANLSVTPLIQSCLPLPAFINGTFIYLPPESNFQGTVRVSGIAHNAFDRTISNRVIQVKTETITEKEGS